MMKLSHFKLVLLSGLLFFSCEKIIMEPAPTTDNLAIFNEYARIAEEKFGLEDVKNVELAALADSIRPNITSDISPEQLFDFMSLITLRMQEGHTSLEAEPLNLLSSYPFFAGFPPGVSTTRDLYYSDEVNPTTRSIEPPDSFFSIDYGFIPGHPDIGFIFVQSFDMEVSTEQLEEMMEYLKDSQGLIVDVRTNLGGRVELASRLASYFTEQPVPFGTNNIKNGPGENDFAASPLVLSPSGSSYTYTKPVTVLHDRVTFSSGSIFTVMIYALDHVTTIGVIFGGGTGEIVDGYLANGWKYVISTSNLVDHVGRPTDNGIEADIPLVIDPNDTVQDALIERAILELTN